MENKQTYAKASISVKRRKESNHFDEPSDSVYAPRSPSNSQNKRNPVETRARSVAEVRSLPKVKTPTKNVKNNKPTISWRNGDKLDISIEAAGKPIISPRNKFKKAFKQNSPYKANFSMQEMPDLSDSDVFSDVKSMKTEIDRLNSTIEAMKGFYKEEERSLHKQITALQKELDWLKKEYSKTVEYLACVIGKHMDKETPQIINDEIIETLREKQEILKLNLEAAINSVSSFKANDKLKLELLNVPNNFENHPNLPSTGRFQGVAMRFSESESETENSPKIECIALYDFYARDPGHLEFKAGDRIIVKSKLDDEWWIGTNKEKTGKFPSSYVMLD